MRRFYLGLLGVTLLASGTLALPAGATAQRSGGNSSRSAAAVTSAPIAATLPHGYAMYDGKTINMAKGWSGAKFCLLPSQGNAQCFDTLPQAKAAAQEISAQEVANDAAAEASAGASTGANARKSASAALGAHTLGGRDDGPCQGDNTQWLWLFQNSYFGGVGVAMQGTDTWWDLNGLGFADQATSYINDTGCYAFAIQTYDGSGPWLTITPWSWSGWLGGWNDTIAMVYIAQY